MNTKQTLDLLRGYESRNVTFMERDGTWPIVWERARGVHVWDVEGKKYLDLTAAFGVATAGHANARVVHAGRKQMARLLHAMGDVHPHALKAKLARELSRITFERWIRKSGKRKAENGKTIFCNSGFEAVEAALKTAVLATNKRGVIAFEGAYHGLGYGALNATHREHFRVRFRQQLGQFVCFAPFPSAGTADARSRNSSRQDQSLVTSTATEAAVRRLFREHKIGAILVEPIQGRGGINIPPPDFLPMLRRVCDEHDALLVLDEIFTGFGRTGAWFACEHSGAVPDVICVGKALTGGFPLSACVGRADLMDAAWPSSTGEAIHTSTFLGHPVGCAMALANIGEIRARNLVEHSACLGELLLTGLSKVQSPKSRIVCRARGVGLMAGLELTTNSGAPAAKLALRVVKEMLQQGFILLPEGEHSNVISFTPPLVITEAQLRRTARQLATLLS